MSENSRPQRFDPNYTFLLVLTLLYFGGAALLVACTTGWPFVR